MNVILEAWSLSDLSTTKPPCPKGSIERGRMKEWKALSFPFLHPFHNCSIHDPSSKPNLLLCFYPRGIVFAAETDDEETVRLVDPARNKRQVRKSLRADRNGRLVENMPFVVLPHT
jgi:hypothetical protein